VRWTAHHYSIKFYLFIYLFIDEFVRKKRKKKAFHVLWL
jgi:hypothetical protein